MAVRHGEPKAFDLDAFADRTTEFALAAIAALLVGALLASAIHALRLSWTVSLAPLPLAALAFVFSSLLGVALAGALVLTAIASHRWQRDEADRGGVEAERGRGRRGLAALSTGRRERKRWVRKRVQDGRLALGETRSGDVATVPFGSREGVRAFIPGAPGSGKTVDLAVHAATYVADGQAVVAIDPKGDGGLRSALASAAASSGRRFIQWSPDGETVYNPLARGNPSELTDKALAGETWTEPH